MELSRVCIVVGSLLVGLGVLLSLLPRGLNLFGWFGKLPGDISYRSDSTVVWIPITSMLIVSAVVSVVSLLVQRLGR